MPAAQGFINELQFERISTRKFLERVPVDQFDWRPHARSQTLRELASHVAQIPSYLSGVATKSEMNFDAGNYVPFMATSIDELVQVFEQNMERALADIATVSDQAMDELWSLRSRNHVIFSIPRRAAFRSFAINHFIHHRGQLSVYLRILGMPIPSIYGPSADEGILRN